MKKRILCLCLSALLVTALLCGMTFSASADDRIPTEEETVIAFLQKAFSLDPVITDRVDILDLNGQSAFVYFEFESEDGTGYAIFDKTLRKIAELSTDHPLNVPVTEATLYGGPNILLEPVVVEDVCASVNGEKSPYVVVKDLLRGMNRPFTPSALSKLAAQQTSARSAAAERMAQTSNVPIQRVAYPIVEKLAGADKADWLYLAGQYHGDCGVNAIAMVERYYDLYLNSNALPSTLNTESLIKRSVVAYITTSTTYYSNGMTISSISSVLAGHSATVGLNGFALSTSYGSYQWNTVRNKLSANRPVLLGLLQDPTYGNHAIVACGYMEMEDASMSMLYVNDGWGNYKYIGQEYVFGYVLSVN